MNIIHIETLEIADLLPYTRLTEAQLRNRLEPEKGIFICESLKVVRVALERGYRPLSFLCEEQYIEHQLSTLKFDETVPVYTAPREKLAQLTGYELTRGFLCAMRRPQLPTPAELCDGKRRIALLDGVVNSTNTGAIFRAATALGIEALLLTTTCCDPLNRRSVRVSMGTVLQMPWGYIEGEHAIEALRSMGFTTIALALSDKAESIDSPTLQRHERIAIVMGTEGDGLPAQVIASCDHVAMIPMQKGVDSLNVAAAAAVAFWQLRPGQDKN